MKTSIELSPTTKELLGRALNCLWKQNSDILHNHEYMNPSSRVIVNNEIHLIKTLLQELEKIG